MNLPLSQRLAFILEAINKNKGVLLIIFGFIIIGSILIYIGSVFGITFLYIFGSCFILGASFFLLYTMPSSLLYHYEKALIREYGYSSVGTVIDKEIEDNSYTEKINNTTTYVKQINYIITYTYKYKNQPFKNSFFIDTKNQYEKLKVGDIIPIKFLKINPKKSDVRTRTLYKKLAL